MRLRLAAITALVLALAVPSAASALTFRINNESGRSPEEVFVTVVGSESNLSAPIENDVPIKLSEIPGGTLTINKLVSGRVYVSYGAPVTEGEPFNSPTRFDWAELTVTPADSDVANLTAVDQVAIGMRLDTFDASEEHLEEVGAANSNTIFNALQEIPGGPQATIRNASGEIIRVLSPVLSTAYPDLGEYVRSLAGKTITLHTAFFGSPFTNSLYTGTFAPDGSITLTGATNPPGEAPASFSIEGSKLIEDIYTDNETPNDVEGTIKRDLFAGFSAGFWGGRYGNDAIGFCTNPQAENGWTFCPSGFNQPPFGDARASLSPFPTCEQYAAVIDHYADEYGNSYSDASGKVTVSLDQEGAEGVKTLQLTILPDSGNAGPVSGGNPNCGAAIPEPAGKHSTPGGGGGGSAGVQVRFLKSARLHGAKLKVGRISCPTACGAVRAIARKGKKVVARAKLQAKASRRPLRLRLTGAGRGLLQRAGRLKVRLDVWVTPPEAEATHVRRVILLIS